LIHFLHHILITSSAPGVGLEPRSGSSGFILLGYI